MKAVNKLIDSTIHKLHIADREADVYDLFFHAFEPNTDFLVRARHNRSLKQGTKLWDRIAQLELAATITLEIPDKKEPHKKRELQAEVRYDQVDVKRPSTAKKDSFERMTLTAIEVREINSNAPKKDQLHWKLLTTLEVGSLMEALQCVKWYCMRWLIERFHYPQDAAHVLKSGTKIEELQLKSAQRLQKAIFRRMLCMVYSMAAFRGMQVVYEGRYHPSVSCELVLTKAQWITLYMFIHKNLNSPKSPLLHSRQCNESPDWVGIWEEKGMNLPDSKLSGEAIYNSVLLPVCMN
jgi:hypothetical protein